MQLYDVDLFNSLVQRSKYSSLSFSHVASKGNTAVSTFEQGAIPKRRSLVNTPTGGNPHIRDQNISFERSGE